MLAMLHESEWRYNTRNFGLEFLKECHRRSGLSGDLSEYLQAMSKILKMRRDSVMEQYGKLNTVIVLKSSDRDANNLSFTFKATYF